MQSLEQDLKLFGNNLSEEILVKAHHIIVLHWSGSRDMNVVGMGTVR